MNTSITISNSIRYDTQMQNINHSVTTTGKITSSDPSGVYVPAEKVIITEKDTGDHVNVTKKFGNHQTLITQNADEIKLTAENLNKSKAEIKVTTDRITQSVTDLSNNTSAKFELQAGQIQSTVEGLNGAKTQINQLSNEISSKVDEDDFGSLITQNARSVKVAWNNISNYATIDDTDGLILGNQDDDSYTKVGYNGRLELCMGNGEKPYHCLQYTDSEEIECSSDGYETVSVSLPSMFDDIDDDDISVSVSIQKVYRDGECLPYWFGGYGEVVNGTLKLKAMSMWRKYYNDSNDDSDWIEKFSSPVEGSIILRYTVIA